MRYFSAVVLAVALISMGISCGEKGVPPGEDVVSSALTIVAGDGQVDIAGSLLTDSLTVRVVNSLGVPVVGDTVTFSQISKEDGGQIIFVTRFTDDQGYAFTRYRLDTLVGVDTIEAVSVAVGDSAVFFEFTVIAGTAASLIRSSDSLLTTIAGEPLPDPVVIQVTDRYGNPAGNEKVHFVTSNRCVLGTDSTAMHPFETDSAYTLCDSDGLASAVWTLSVSPNPFGLYPHTHILDVFINIGDTLGDTVRFTASATYPGVLEYYYDIRPIFDDNCFQCHGQAADTSYRVDYYYQLVRDGNMTPGDTNSPILARTNPYNPDHFWSNANAVEEDKVIHWVVTDNGEPGSSGLNNYNSHIKNIIDASCISCHGDIVQENNYKMTTHAEIRGNGLDATPNAIPGADSSLVVQKMLARHNWQFLDPDSVSAAILADSIVTWIMDDLIREY